MKPMGIVLVLAALLLCASPVLAQTGVVQNPGNGNGSCVNSPENPTALLALVGTAGGFCSYAWARRRARREK